MLSLTSQSLLSAAEHVRALEQLGMNVTITWAGGTAEPELHKRHTVPPRSLGQEEGTTLMMAGAKRSWRAARKLARAKGMSIMAARSELARQKRQTTLPSTAMA